LRSSPIQSHQRNTSKHRPAIAVPLLG